MKEHFDISLMDESMIEYMKGKDGLCFKRFHADIITKDLDYSKLQVEDILTIDNKKIRLTRIGKPCFSECKLDNKPCLLNKSVAFGEIIS